MKPITAFIGSHEGFVGQWYLDAVHVPTIGYGFTWNSKIFREWWMAKYGRKMKKGDTISKAEALALLEKCIELEYRPPVVKALPNAAENVKDAASSMVFNCGPGALAWRWAKAIAGGQLKEGCALWRRTATTAKGKSLPGLIRRRREEADIAEFNRYPSWLKFDAPPERRVTSDDTRQAQAWLKSLGYYTGEVDGIAGGKTFSALLRFQRDHGNLKADGILGPATMAALQRAVDLKKKAGGAVAGGGAIAAGGGAGTATTDQTSVVYQVSDYLMWGGIALIVVLLVYLAWRYRDEISTTIRKV